MPTLETTQRPGERPGIGKRLRKARQERRLSIEESAWRTRVRPDLLRALECEQFNVFEHSGFVKRLLGSYARFLGLDHQQIVEDYARRYEPDLPSPIEELEQRERKSKRPPRPKWVIAAGCSAAVLLVAGVVGVLGGEGGHTPATALGPAGPRLTEIAAASRKQGARITLVIEAVGRAHLSVTADGSTAFDGDLLRGQRRSFFGRDWVEIVLGNAAAVRLRVNGRDLGAPGEPGTVFRARFGPGGVVLR